MKRIALLVFLVAGLLSNARAQADYQIGVYYFPGWRAGLKAAPSLVPWEAIKPFKEREPMLGWYDDGDVETVNTQLGWMRSHGLSYVVFDWYWGGGRVHLEQALQAYFSAANRSQMPFALLWSNHDAAPTSAGDFSAMVRYWIDNYFKRPEMFKIDGKPVVFIFDHQHLQERARQFGSDVPSLLNTAQELVRAAGLPPIYFVGSTFNNPKAASLGYSATSAYNYQGLDKPSRSYSQLVTDYAKAWEFQTGRHGVPYIVPMTQGWDRRPWGGSKDPEHDLSGGVPETFEQHLRAAKALMDRQPQQTLRMGVICCWNEFGEGSYIEPTKAAGFTYLERIKAVFGAGKR